LHKKVAIGYSYLDGEKEHPRSLKPWVDKVDHIIAINGRYWTPQSPEMLKSKYPRFSTDNSYQVLKEVCGDKLTHEDFYGTQMEKRQRYLDIAGELGCDFLIVWDTDEMIYEAPNWDRFDKQLTAIYDAWPDQQIFGMLAWIPSRKLWSPQYNEVKPETWVPYQRVHKDPGKMYYCLNHWTWALKEHSREEIYKYIFENPAVKPIDSESNEYLIKSRTTLDAIKFTTNRLLRRPDQLTYGDQWAWQNMQWENFHFLVAAYHHYHGRKFTYEYMQEKDPDIEYYFNDRGFLVPYKIDRKTGECIEEYPTENMTEILEESNKILNPDQN
jgi:hypothetical protein